MIFTVDLLLKKQRVMGTRRAGVATPQYVILAAAPRSMPTAEITSYKPL